MTKKYNRVFVDGCFDLVHFGHYNFLRQVAGLSNEVYVGLHNDKDIAENKGQPVFTLAERISLVESCKWAAKVIPNVPYSTTIEELDENECQVAIHGDDICYDANGENAYKHIIEAGRFDTVPRTKAISTTNLIGRMLRLPASELPESFDKSELELMAGDKTSLHTYIPTSHRIAQFSTPREPERGERIVYCDGTFDLLHPGHVSFLKKAKELGDYLVVGVHDDPTIEALSCPSYPIMTLQERVLNVLAMKYVDDVIIGAPYVITKELMDQIEPSVVVEGSAPTRTNTEDAFRVPKQLGIFKQIESDFPEFTAKHVVHRVLTNYQQYSRRNVKKEAEPAPGFV